MGRTNRTGHKASCSILSTKTSKLFPLFYEYFPHPRYLMRKTSKKLSFGPQGGKGGEGRNLTLPISPLGDKKISLALDIAHYSTKLLKVVIYQAGHYKNFEAMQLLYLGQPAF